MAWWLTVYATRSLATLTAEDVARGLRDGDPDAPAGVDYALLAETYDLDDALVAPAVAGLRVIASSAAPLDLEVRWQPDETLRPIVVHRWDSPERLTEELGECREIREPPPSVEARLGEVVAIVGLELGFPMLENMGIVFATELARYLTQKGAGFFVDDDDQWFAVRDGIIEPIET